MTTKTQAAIEDLYKVPDHGKAELANGKGAEPAVPGWRLPVDDLFA